MSFSIRLRRDIATNWESRNPTLASGEMGLDLTTGQIKIGNGSSAWNNLNFMNFDGNVQEVVDARNSTLKSFLFANLNARLDDIESDVAAGGGGGGIVDGKEVELRATATHLQWKYLESLTWTDLIALSELKGADGVDGTNGVDGAPGAPGADGVDGADGVGVPIGGLTGQVLKKLSNTDFDFVWSTESGGSGGETIELRATATHIQWKYESAVTWTDLIALSELIGADGVDGTNGTNGIDGVDGVDGDQIELQKTATHIQWRYVGGTWENLVLLSEISGADGADGADGVGIPVGGSTGQVLKKSSATDFDVSWANESGGGGGGGSKSARVIVASSTASQAFKDGADYVCTGSNDSTMLGNAIMDITNAGGGKILLSDGEFLISATLFINAPNMTIEGMGKHITKLRRTAPIDMIAWNTHRTTIKNLTIDGNESNGIGLHQYWGTPNTNLTIKDVILTGFWGDGDGAGGASLHLSNCTDIFLDNVSILNCKATQNARFESCVNVRILNSTFIAVASTVQMLLEFISVTNAIVNNCSFEVSGEKQYAIGLKGNRNRLTNCFIKSPTKAIEMSGYFNIVSQNVCDGVVTTFLNESATATDYNQVLDNATDSKTTTVVGAGSVLRAGV